MIRMVFAATKSRKSARTAKTMRAATGFLSGGSVHESRGPADRDDLDALAGLEDPVLVEGARGPHLALDLGAADALVVRDPLQDDRVATDQRRRAGAQLGRHAQVALGDRADEE